MSQEEQKEQLLNLLKLYCDDRGISKSDIGWLIRPRKDLSPAMLVVMSRKLERWGAEYSPTTNTFQLKELPKENKVEPEKLAEIALADLVPAPTTPRLNATLNIQPLYDSMRAKGQKNRIIVRPSPKLAGKYEIIDGNRRKKAAELLGWPTLKAIILNDLTDEDAFELAFILFDRKGLSALEMGRYFKQAMELYPETFPTQLAIALRFGYKTNAQVSKFISYYEEEEARIESLKPKPPSPEDTQKSVANEAESSFSTNIPRGINELNEHQLSEPEPSRGKEGEDAGNAAVKEDEARRNQAEDKGAKALVHDETELLPIPSPTHAAIIRGAPENLQPILRKAAAAGASTRKLEKIIEITDKSKVTPLEASRMADEDYAKQEKAEEAKKKTTVNILKAFCPASILEDVMHYFNRVRFQGVTTEKIAKIVVQLAELEGINLDGLQASWLAAHEAAKQANRLEEFYSKIEEDF